MTGASAAQLTEPSSAIAVIAALCTALRNRDRALLTTLLSATVSASPGASALTGLFFHPGAPNAACSAIALPADLSSGTYETVQITMTTMASPQQFAIRLAESAPRDAWQITTISAASST